MTIPSYLEQLIHQGKAEAKVFTGGLTAQAEIACPTKSYLVVYGYYYKPFNPIYGALYDPGNANYPTINFQDVLQFVGFGYNGKFQTFAHTISCLQNGDGTGMLSIEFSHPTSLNNPEARLINDIAVQERSCYIVSNTNIGISITRSTTNTAIAGAAVLPLPESTDIFNNLSYANQFIEPYVDRYITNAAGQYYYPFPQQTTDSISPLTYGANPGSNQLYTAPGLGGQLPTLNTYATGGGENTMGKVRMPILNVLYVQVNQEPPANLL
jgi:hypothetical protein